MSLDKALKNKSKVFKPRFGPSMAKRKNDPDFNGESAKRKHQEYLRVNNSMGDKH